MCPSPAWHCHGTQPGAGRGVPIFTHPSAASATASPAWSCVPVLRGLLGGQGLFSSPGGPQLQPHHTPLLVPPPTEQLVLI